jgi:hypothetical protein
MEPADMDKMISSEGLEAYRAELGTKPHVLYKNLYKYTKNFITAGILVGGDCFENAAATLTSGGKTVAEQKTNFFGEFKFDGLDDGAYTLEIDADGRKSACEVRVAGESVNLGFIEL